MPTANKISLLMKYAQSFKSIDALKPAMDQWADSAALVGSYGATCFSEHPDKFISSHSSESLFILNNECD